MTRLSTLANLVIEARPGAVSVLAGIDRVALRRRLDQVEADRTSPRVLFAPVAPARSVEAIVAQVIDLLAETVQRLWPLWFTDVSFAECRNDKLGQLAATAVVRRVAGDIPGLSPSWAEAAVELALADRPPRVRAALPAVELAQLALAISRHGLVLVVDGDEACQRSSPAAVVYALEWIAQHADCAVVALFSQLPAREPPFDRILYGARTLLAEQIEPEAEAPRAEACAESEIWLAPWLGSPHPLSEAEQRLAKALRTDAELGSLFGCNQFVDTVRGSRPKVDFVWQHGRLAVELDGYGSHGNRAAFMYDRHRDYELTLSGYTVLRLANDEIAQDIGKAIEKIRDIVHLCRDRMK
ncbi:endonuclease domain-containing protein [Rhodopseudomonas palustris]|uniref:endonuclease domain-containing protein n=1 Tax=Rhodopseudomonas palustris TaxID=1076 RepID=UPI00142EB72E